MSHRHWRGAVLTAAGDLALFHLTFLAAFLVRFGGRVHPSNSEAYALLAPWASAALLLFFSTYGLYGDRPVPWTETLHSLIPASAALFLAVGALSFFLRGFSFPRSVFLIALVLFPVLSALWHRWIHMRLLGGRRAVLVAPTGDERGHRLARDPGALAPGTVTVLRLEKGAAGSVPEVAAALDELLAGAKPDDLIIDRSLTPEQKRWLVEVAVATGVRPLLIPDFYEAMLAGSTFSRVDDVPVLVCRPLALASAQAAGKRLLDVIVTGGLLLLSAPLLGAVALATYLDSGCPVFYLQERAGQDGRPFKMIKFRTMIPGAEDGTGPVLSVEGDPRVTRVGRFLRRVRLDELPQLLNVLRGDMSLVGPRPERPSLAAEYAGQTAGYTYRTRVKPGLTGWAQVEGKYSTPPEDKLCFDLLYAQRYTPVLDLRILLLTLKAVLRRDRSG